MRPLGQIAGREFPVLGRVVDALQKPLFLLFLGDVEENFHNAVAVVKKILLIISDLAVALFKKCLFALAQHAVGHLVSLLQVVYLHHKHILIIAAVEDGDGPARRQRFVDAPEEVVLQFLAVGLFKARDLHALGVQPGHNVFDRAVLACGVQRLQNNDKPFAPIGVKGVLQSGHFLQILGRFGYNFVLVRRVVLAIAGQRAQITGAGAVKAVFIGFHGQNLPQNIDINSIPGFDGLCNLGSKKKGRAGE